ncbi:MAG: orotate phosphoribosyltransferase [Gammaproteobacteria bacterium]|nr:orotate phosphoribosyltransferase [Gammaproteobacteria bacterium]NNL99698.1 orotate phosphoribosyltransferase [Gammaproteobacteria bacterium]
MHDYQREFIAFALEHQVLRFGEFTLKSGRLSPYFFNTGLFNSGAALGRLGEFYAHAIVTSGIPFDMVYGPAYKGIPLASAAAIALAGAHRRDVPYCFNRKEAKDHGEGGMTLGAPLAGRVLIIDDVISAGTSVNESVEMIRGAGAEPAGVVIALDRQERGSGPTSAVEEVTERHGIPVTSVIGLREILAWLADDARLGEFMPAVEAYRAEYGNF